MRVLVACEFSGRVREAMRAQGHDAVSCDMLPSELPGPHIQGDVLNVLHDGWDLAIMHPPCTLLASSGARWWASRLEEQERAIAFALALWHAPIARIALENPIGKLSSVLGKPSQIIQPWQFGEEESKATCLWLKGLPPLFPTQVMATRNRNLTPSGQNRVGPSPERWKIRSRTYAGIASAMAAQWG